MNEDEANSAARGIRISKEHPKHAKASHQVLSKTPESSCPSLLEGTDTLHINNPGEDIITGRIREASTGEAIITPSLECST